MDHVVLTGLTFVGKLRSDANLKTLYTGPQTGKAGRPRRYVNKVNWKDLSSWTLELKNEERSIQSKIVYAPALKRDILVVCITWFTITGKNRREVLFSTNLEMPALEAITGYRAWFEMEFPFRDRFGQVAIGLFALTGSNPSGGIAAGMVACNRITEYVIVYQTYKFGFCYDTSPLISSTSERR